jgi:hypothetical protein
VPVKWVHIKGEVGGNFRRDGNSVFECPPEEIKETHEQLPQQPITETVNTEIRTMVVSTLRNRSVILYELAISCIIKTTIKSIRF